MRSKILMSLVWILSLSASAGESIVRISEKMFSVKHDDCVELANLSSNQIIDLLKSNEVYELNYSPLGNLIRKNRIKLGTWTETNMKLTRIGSWTETGGKIINSIQSYNSNLNRGE